MDYAKTPQLSTQRLVLRELTLDDMPAAVEISVYDGVYATNEADAIDIHNKVYADVAQGESMHWGIFSSDGQTLLGSCGYYRGFADESGEIGYLLKTDARGHGYMGEAVKCIVDFGLDVLKLKTVVAFTSPDNLASIAVLQKAGFGQVTSTDDDLKFELGK